MVIASRRAYSRAQELVLSRLIVGGYELTASATVARSSAALPARGVERASSEHVRRWELN